MSLNLKERAVQNKLLKVIEYTPVDQKLGMRWLVAHMTDQDKTSLDIKFLLENCDYAYRAWENTPWDNHVPDSIFYEYILPFSNLNERRDNWRKNFYNLFYDLVDSANSAYEAATILNKNIYKILNVTYSPKRPKADQSPYESIDAGLASCTGLSFLLIDACRSVGIPARFVGTPLWYNNSGNHSWVEIWDNGWHFTGAFEPTENRLNEAWFTDLASRAVENHPKHGIYAATWRKTDIYFPMEWKPNEKKYYAYDVTKYYKRFLNDELIPLTIKVSNKSGARIKEFVKIIGDNDFSFNGYSKSALNDINDHLTLYLPIGSKCIISVRNSSKNIIMNEEKLVEFTF